MSIRILALVLALSTLPSCMLDQNAPAATQKGNTGGGLGLVVMEDTQGSRRSAQVTALFGKKTDAKAISRFRLERGGCTVDHAAIQKARAAAADSITLVTVGKLGVGPALQSALVQIPESDKHQYAMKLDPDFAAGVYQVVAEGSASLGAFTELLSVPEALHDVKANGTAFDTSDLIVKRNEPLKFEWRVPSVTNDANVMLLDFFVQTETEIYQLSCGATEKSLLSGTDATVTWTIPTDVISQLPASPKAEVRVTRGHELQARGGIFQGRLQGLRKSVDSATVN